MSPPTSRAYADKKDMHIHHPRTITQAFGQQVQNHIENENKEGAYLAPWQKGVRNLETVLAEEATNWSSRETVNAASPRVSPCAPGLRFSSRSQQAKTKRSSIARAGFLQQQQIGAMVVRDWGLGGGLDDCGLGRMEMTAVKTALADAAS
ncbi:hypothetical protein ACLOJK_041642 [Asimina triloba]